MIFTDQTYPAAASASSPAPMLIRLRHPQRDYPPVGVRTSMIPVGTEVQVRMIESVNSETARLGQTFRASLDEADLRERPGSDSARRRCADEAG